MSVIDPEVDDANHEGKYDHHNQLQENSGPWQHFYGRPYQITYYVTIPKVIDSLLEDPS